MNLSKYFGNRRFYRTVLLIAVPIMIQNGITNFVSLLDNVMVGQLGTEAMSSVSIVNNLIFVFNLLIFGAISSAGIFTAQFHGFGDTSGVRYTFRFKMITILIATALSISVFVFASEPLINLFLHDSDSGSDLALTLSFAKDYLAISIIGLLPYAIAQVYASTLRETAKTVLPMIASISAVFSNFILNYILIFGNFGAPALGIRGAAIATVISRFIELAILIIWTHINTKKCSFIAGAYRSLRIPLKLVKDISLGGLPLMINELLWASAIAITMQCYSTRGLDVVAALNITTTINNVFNVVYLALGSSIAIIVGNLLGAGKLQEAKETDTKMITFSILCSIGFGLLLIAASAFIPQIYNTTPQVRSLSTFMIIISACIMPFAAYAHSVYFTMRSGGQVMITLLFDSAYMWLIVIPVAFCLSRFTPLNIYYLYPICQGLEIVKAVFGFLLLKRETWIKQLVGNNKASI